MRSLQRNGVAEMERMEAHGYSGLADRRKGKPGDKRVPVARVEKVLQLYGEVYFDLNIRHFHEKLEEEHQIKLSYTWVQLALQGAGLVARRGKRGKHRCCCTSTGASTIGSATAPPRLSRV